ncbi:hypothetical protein N7457_008911 [Penicillium paradoxum]|uniref:uncharacterized protein n=1 Tax=Penicillium paradoxum TaxID=176176 RepID=UPI002547FA3E|nr:uncharacterized protein N7457_008911 [Penicillium paradoxum]KAJ5774015.1 hypothetical protein N7457_008911 [Penicillium paradoxum]
MTPHERLMMLLEGDMGLMDLDTGLNRPSTAPPAQAEDEAVRGSKSDEAKQGVSGNFSEFYRDPNNPMVMTERQNLPVSYVRSFVIGQSAEPENNRLTGFNQGDDDSSDSLDLHLDELEHQGKDNGGVGPSMVGKQVTTISTLTRFTPAVAMARFPFKYVHGENSKRIDARFYQGNKFWNRTWDLYYLPVPKAIYERVFLLIPTVQAQGFINEINSTLRLNLTLMGPGKQGLVVAFNDDSPVRPILLGQSSSLAQKIQLEESVPVPFKNWGMRPLMSRVSKDFEERIKESVATIKKKWGKDAQKQADQDARIKMWTECLCRVQAYFGLRPPLQPGREQPSFANRQIRRIDVLSPVKWYFHDAPIFLSIDIEWNERYPSQLTEVGISTLDTMDLRGLIPGDYGELWMKEIRTRHLRVAEYKNWVNHEFVSGCPTKFGFGKSEIIPNAEIPEVVDAAFQPPYMVAAEDDRIPRYKTHKRNLILVGINLRNDLKLLREKQCQVFLDLKGSSSIIREVVDVAELYRVEHGELQLRGLQSLLGVLNILSCDLHNAGNDAHYTMQALVRLMLWVAGEQPAGHERADSDSREDRDKKPKVEPKDEMSGGINEDRFT